MNEISDPRLTRRKVLGAALGLGSAAAFGGQPAFGGDDLKGKTVVFASWGGAYQDAEKLSYCDPFAQITGARVVQDGPMNAAKFRAMIEGGAPDWDVADVTIDFLYAGIGDRLFEKIDRTIVDTSRIDPRFVNEYGIGCIVWSNNVTYSTKAFAGRGTNSPSGRMLGLVWCGSNARFPAVANPAPNTPSQ